MHCLPIDMPYVVSESSLTSCGRGNKKNLPQPLSGTYARTVQSDLKFPSYELHCRVPTTVKSGELYVEEEEGEIAGC